MKLVLAQEVRRDMRAHYMGAAGHIKWEQGTQ